MKQNKILHAMYAEARRTINFREERIPSGKVVMDKKRKALSRQALKRSLYKEARYY